MYFCPAIETLTSAPVYFCLVIERVLLLLQYFLVDDTLEVREVHPANDGRDPFPVLIRRDRVPKNR